MFFVPVAVEGELRRGALEEPFTRPGTGDSVEMSLAVTVPRTLGPEGDELATDFAGGVAAPEVGAEPEEGGFGFERVVARTELADEDFVTLGEAGEVPEFTIKFTRAAAEVEDGFTILDFDGVVTGVVAPDFVTVLEGAMTVVPVCRSDDPLPTVMVGMAMVGDLDFSVRLACSLRVLSMSFLVLASCMATLAYDN